jgi:hypothetical protein
MEEGYVIWIGPAPAGPGFCPKCGAVVTTSAHGAREIQMLETFLRASREGISDREQFEQATSESKQHWIECNPSLYALPLGKEEGTLILVQITQEGLWAVEHMPRNSRGKTEELFQGAMAVCHGVAEDYARSKGALAVSRKEARWRVQAATTGQLSALERWRVNVSGRAWTRGEASDAMTRAVVQSRYRRRLREVSHG